MRFFITLLFLVGGIMCSSQIKLNIKVSDRHLQKVEQAKDARAKLRSYKKYYTKDSLKAAKAAWRTYKKQYKDSLKVEGRWKEAKDNQDKILKGEWEQYTQQLTPYKLDSLTLPDPRDSLDWALRQLALQDDYQQLQQLYAEVAHYDSAYLDRFHFDSIRIDTARLIERFQLKERMASYLPEELKQQTDLDIASQLKSGMINEFGDIQKIDKSGVKVFFQNVKPEQLAKAQLSLQAAKKKYLSLPNLEKKEEGIKKRSLTGTPWKKRIYLGGNFAVQSTDPLIIDGDLRAGYRFSKALSAGTGLVIREQFSKSATALTGDGHGYSLFVSYEVLGSYFLYGEYQSMRNAPLFSESELPVRWEQAWLAGVGRTIRLSKKISTTVSLLYDFNFKQNNLNARPIVVRFGYKVDL